MGRHLRAMKSSLKIFESHSANTEAMYTGRFFFIVVGIGKSWVGFYQFLHWSAMPRVEDWVEERRKVGSKVMVRVRPWKSRLWLCLGKARIVEEAHGPRRTDAFVQP